MIPKKKDPLKTIYTLLFLLSMASASALHPIHSGFQQLDLRNLKEAEEIFLVLQKDENPHVQQFGYLGMGKIALAENRFLEAEKWLKKMDEPMLSELRQEWLYTQGELALKTNHLDFALTLLEKALNENPTEKTAFLLDEVRLQKELQEMPWDQAMLLLEKKEAFLKIGFLLYEHNQFGKAIETFETFLSRNPNSPWVPEAIFWLAKSREAASLEFKSHYKEIYERFPDHHLAPISYFNYYSLQDYLLGERGPIKHLHEFKIKFPHSPLNLHAYYLEGLDYLRDRKTLEGKWICRQNLTAAIDAFQKVETTFEKLQTKQECQEWLPLRYQATLEKGKTNFAIAKGAKPAKKAIYLEYAKEIFQSLIAELKQGSPERDKSQVAELKTDRLDPILEESLFNLALVKIESDEKEAALATLDQLLSQYKVHQINKGYYLASALFQKALLENDASLIHLIDEALEAAHPSYLSHDEILEMMLAKANYYRKIGDLDQAMLHLSSVVNAETASSQRLKAMFLRAEVYAEQGRTKLAQNQLEAIVLKGGSWAQKAKEQLEQLYNNYE